MAKRIPREKSATVPKARGQTIRQALLQQLQNGPLTVRELSGLIGAREKEIEDHLVHLQKSLARTNQRLVVDPAVCLGCDFAFESRKRLTKPSSCPKCRGQRIAPPEFLLS